MTTMPSLFETVVANGNYETLPQPEVPYYVVAREGVFDHKHTEIGNVLLKRTQPIPPEHLTEIGIKDGVFTWQGDKVPARIISQAFSFFERIYDKYHSEAEALITKNDAGDFRLFIPYQRASHAGVKSIYEPTHVSRGWLVVGTLHSHCDFSAFHSGTDSGDASDMDGVHFTIGNIKHPEPQIVAMVAMSGKEFHYNTVSDIAEIAWTEATAPEWWDEFVYAGTRTAPETKPAGLISLTQEHWNEFLGRALVKQTAPKVWGRQQWTPTYTNYGGAYPTAKTWEPFPVRERDWSTTDWRDWGKPKKQGYADDVEQAIETILDKATELNLFTDDEWDETSVTDMNEIEYWKGFFIQKAANIQHVLAMIEGVTKPHTTKRRKKLLR